MSPKAAAPVLINMSDTEALRILTNLKPDKLAAILEKWMQKMQQNIRNLWLNNRIIERR